MKRLLPPFGHTEKGAANATEKTKGQWEIEHLGKISHAPYLTTLAACIAVEVNDLEATKVAAIETLGIPLGVALSIHLGVGIVVLRKGNDRRSSMEFTSESYRQAGDDEKSGLEMISLFRRSFSRFDRVLLVDDDSGETGAQFLAAKTLIEKAGASVVAGIFLRISDRGKDALAGAGFAIFESEMVPPFSVVRPEKAPAAVKALEALS